MAASRFRRQTTGCGLGCQPDKHVLDDPDQVIAGIVADKSVTYRKADEYWLVIDSSGLPSETALPINTVNKFNANHVLNFNLKSSPFAMVYCFTAIGL